MPNIKFNYLYRDAGNYKNSNSIIFDNPQNMSLSTVEALIISKLIFHHWFYANQWQVPDLYFGTWDGELDHTFHEFESVEYTDKPGNDGTDIALFINMLQTVVNPS